MKDTCIPLTQLILQREHRPLEKHNGSLQPLSLSTKKGGGGVRDNCVRVYCVKE